MAPNATSTTFQGGPEGTNNILGGGQGETGEHEAAYGGIYTGQVTGHNGATGGDGY